MSLAASVHGECPPARRGRTLVSCTAPLTVPFSTRYEIRLNTRGMDDNDARDFPLAQRTGGVPTQWVAAGDEGSCRLVRRIFGIPTIVSRRAG